MKHRTLLCLVALILAAVVLWQALQARPQRETLPGTQNAQRRLIRIWVCSSVGGGESWLRERLRAWEKQTPGAMTFLRTVTPDEFAQPGAVLPDVLLYTPGVVTAPEELFAPLNGVTGLREPLLRAGRWQMQQYGLPLCYGCYALAVDSAAEPHLAVTPAPTTLLGHPAATALPEASEAPGLPEGVTPLAPQGCGLFTLGCLAKGSLPAEGTPASAEVFRIFQARQASAALLTTGQLTALTGSFPFRTLTPEEIITDQVWLASLFPQADESAASLLAFLTSAESQRTLSQQGLYTVREDLRLYAAGYQGQLEAASARALTAINAYIPAADVHAAAWQYVHGQTGLSEALVPLL